MQHRGNPDWKRDRPLPVPTGPPLFDLEIERLGLTNPESWVESSLLREWCEQNRNHCYIPEWLLKEWNIVVNARLI